MNFTGFNKILKSRFLQALIDKLGAELKDTMEMCGAADLSQITRDMVRV